jgi:2',3'-cyclic-nucleotide 2'-phosphodiesterase
MKILLIGDIVGSPGRMAVKKIVPTLREKYGLDFVIANGENTAGGSGITPEIASELFSYNVDVITLGDHAWRQRKILDGIGDEKRLLRPANFPVGVPGRGSAVFYLPGGVRVGVINLAGRVFMPPLDCPFRRVAEEIDEIRGNSDVIVLDFHAEATSEKIAMGWYLDGRVSVVAGTHTHVQTSDERILPKGTAYITDIGMTGPFDSVLGRDVNSVIKRFLTQMPTRFQVASNDIRLCGVIAEVDPETGKAVSIERVEEAVLV